MAQHDYVIANGTGAAVRSDLNNALAAIVSNNSGATEPTTTYAYMWWPDTSTGLLKLRNGANNAWITLRELDGTLTIEDGTASSPGLAFADDLNTGIYSPSADQLGITTGGTVRLTTTTTGITSALPVDVPLGTASAPTVTFTGDLNTGVYSPGADQVAISTNGSGRLFVGSTGNIGVATSSPAGLFDVRGFSYLSGAQIRDSSNVAKGYVQGDARGFLLATDGSTNIAFDVNGTERMRLDSSGRLGIGTTSPGNFGYFAVRGFAALGGSYGNVSAHFSDGVTNSLFIKHAAGEIGHFSDGATAQSFYTNSTERARIDSSGRLLVGTSTGRNVGAANNRNFQIEGDLGASITRNSNDNNGGSLCLAKSRGTSAGGVTVVQNGDSLGSIFFAGADGTDLETIGAGIEAKVDGAPGSNDLPTRLEFSVTRDGASSPTEALRIMNGGGVYTFCSSTSDALNPATAAAAGTSRFLMTGAHSATGVDAGGTLAFRIYTNGNMQNINNSYAGISDVKLKENIVDAGSQWSDLKGLQVRKYNFKKETGHETHTQIGLVAQEAELVSPGLVYETPDRDEDGNDLGTVTKSVNYSVLYMKAVKALQEAMERIEQLEAEMAEVKAQLS